MTKRIPLTQGLFATVDDEDFVYLMQWRWYANKYGNTFYAVRTTKLPFRKTILMHRVIMNTPNGMDVDHINGDGLHNVRANLRNCTTTQNLQNTRKRSDNTSGYRGVHWYKARGKWQAYIHVNGERIHLGYFSTAEQAAHAHDEAAKQHHGEFANLNF
jgi:hypothetical protein